MASGSWQSLSCKQEDTSAEQSEEAVQTGYAGSAKFCVFTFRRRRGCAVSMKV